MTQPPHFDVFLCHNSEDKPAVIQIADQLKQRNISPWLDIWELRPGFLWQRVLEEQIEQIGAAAVLVGKKGLGPWQSHELDAFLRRFANKQRPVIPVLLPEAPKEPNLPTFLEGYMWVDFRLSYPDPMGQLIWGVTGQKPAQSAAPKPRQRTEPNLELESPLKIEIPADDLSSEKGVDYTKLRDLLKARKLEEADYETYLVMLRVVGRKEGDWIRAKELLNFPCTDLRTIDQLWAKYSNGRFGFSVQKKIYLECGGKPDGKYYEEAWERFGDRVGWKVNSSWISYDDVKYDTSGPTGHLPFRVRGVRGSLMVRVGGGGLFSRIKTCIL